MERSLDQTKRNQVIGILATGGTRALAARYVGCHPRTIYNTAKTDPAFAKELNHAETSPEYYLLKTVTMAGMADHVVHAAKWSLERIYPDRYRPRKPGTFSFEAVKQVIDELTFRLAEKAPDEQERRRILETASAFAKEITGTSLDLPEEIFPAFSETAEASDGSMSDAPEATLSKPLLSPTDRAGDAPQQVNSHGP